MLQEPAVDGEDADSVVVVVGDVDVVVLVAADAVGNFELSVPAAVPSDGVQEAPVGREHLDAVAARVGHQQPAAARHTHVARERELERLAVVLVAVCGVLFRAGGCGCGCGCGCVRGLCFVVRRQLAGVGCAGGAVTSVGGGGGERRRRVFIGTALFAGAAVASTCSLRNAVRSSLSVVRVDTHPAHNLMLAVRS